MHLTLLEYETSEGVCLTTQELAALERANRTAGVEILRPVVRAGAIELQAAQYVGVVRFGGRTVQILPKIYRDQAQGAERAREAACSLLRLLTYTDALTVRASEVAALTRQNADWFEILTRLFATRLWAAWRRGAARGYETREEELTTLRGKWRLADQLRQAERQHRFAVTYDELTTDSPLNRCFRFVVERCWRLTRSAANRKLLDALRQAMGEVLLPGEVTAVEADRMVRTCLHREATPLLHLARLFLDGGALQLAPGDLMTFAFVFDMNQLFEAFVIAFLCRHRREILPSALQFCELLPQARGAQFYLAQTDGKPAFRLKPDLAFRLPPDPTIPTPERFPLLLDAKYRRLREADQSSRTSGVSEDDLYQMLAYAQRYNCPRLLLIYPQMAQMAPVQRRFALSGAADTVIEAATIDVRGDLESLETRQVLMERFRLLLRSLR